MILDFSGRPIRDELKVPSPLANLSNLALRRAVVKFLRPSYAGRARGGSAGRPLILKIN